MEGWGPHSTRGAGVLLYHRLGMPADQVAQLGRWKNRGAFQEHYLRLDAPDVAAQKIGDMVHNDSPGIVPEPERTRTPGTEDQGGRVLEGAGTRHGEPSHTHPVSRQFCGGPGGAGPSGGVGPPLRFAFARSRPLHARRGTPGGAKRQRGGGGSDTSSLSSVGRDDAISAKQRRTSSSPTSTNGHPPKFRPLRLIAAHRGSSRLIAAQRVPLPGGKKS